MREEKWEKVGVVGVDAGLLWLGDPCYIMTKDASNFHDGTWHEWLDKLWKLEEEQKNNAVQWSYQNGHPGLGISVSTGFGDGKYDVFVRRDSQEKNRIAEVRVVFIEREVGFIDREE